MSYNPRGRAGKNRLGNSLGFVLQVFLDWRGLRVVGITGSDISGCREKGEPDLLAMNRDAQQSMEMKP